MSNRIKERIEEEKILDNLRNQTEIDFKESHNLCRSYMIALRNLPDPHYGLNDFHVSIKNSYFGYVVFHFQRKTYMIESIYKYMRILEMKRARCAYWELKGIDIISGACGLSNLVNEPPDDIEYTRTMEGFESVHNEIAGQARNDGEEKII